MLDKTLLSLVALAAIVPAVLHSDDLAPGNALPRTAGPGTVGDA